MFNGGYSPSLSDIASVVGNNEGFGGGNGGWWVLIILFFLCGGWGRGGYGSQGGVSDGYVLASDFANIERKIDTVNGGLCDGFYAMNTGMLNGFSGINSNIMQSTFNVQTGINNLSSQLAQCCCDNKAGLADLKYTMATDACAITTAINQAAQNIMQNDNANFRQLHDENVAMQMAAKDETIANLRSQLDRCTYRTDNAMQTQEIINTLRPMPQPSYNVQNPWEYSGSGCGCRG